MVIIDNNGSDCLEEVLLEAVIPSASFIGDHFILMQDTAHPHSTRCHKILIASGHQSSGQACMISHRAFVG